MIKNMVFTTEKYVFIDSRTRVSEEIGKTIKDLPKAFILQCKTFCPFITEYSYNEHTKEAILVCRFDNEKDFCETDHMNRIAGLINTMHKCIASYITFNVDKTLRECKKHITDIINSFDNGCSCEALGYKLTISSNDDEQP